MIQPSTRARLTRTPWRMLLAVLLVVGLGSARAEAAHAQTPAGLVQLRGEYQGALSTLEAALAAYSVAESRFHQALDSVTAARESGDEGRHERALTVAQAQAQPVRGREDRVRRTTERVEEAREHLVDGLEAELERLYGVEDTTSLAELAGLRATIADMENELDEVRPSLAGFEVQPAILVQLRIDPTDGPNDILNKADLLERRAARHAAQIRDVEDRLTELGRRLRLQRIRRTNIAGLNRFDDASVPVGSAGQTGTQSRGGEAIAPTDSTGVLLRPQTIEEEIRSLEQLRDDLVALRERILDQAASFRARAGGDVL